MSINPADSQVFGALFSTDEMRSLFSDRAQLQFMLDVEAGLARAEAALGLIPASISDAICTAARVDNLRIEEIAASTRKVGYPVAAIVKQVGEIAGLEVARYVHLGATTQDILDTAVVLQSRAAAGYIRRDLVALAKSLARRATEFRDTPMAARTHLQHAVPTTFGLKCATWAAPLVDHVERLDQALSRLLVVQFGGAAGTLAGLGADGPSVAAALARELGLGEPILPWHSTRDRFAETTAILALISGTLSKFATDIALLTQAEVAEVSEPYEQGRGASSTMPQKHNPIASEYIIACARGVHALAPLMFSAMASDHERATGPWQSEALAIAQCYALTAGALAHALAIAQGMTVDATRMRRNLDLSGGLIMAESVVNGLVPALGRAAAEKAVAQACQRALDEHKSLGAVLRDDARLRPHLNDAEIDRLTDPLSYLGSAGAFVDRVVARIDALQ